MRRPAARRSVSQVGAVACSHCSGGLGSAGWSFFFFVFFCNTSPKSLLESPQEASPSYRVSPTSQVTVSEWGSSGEKGAVDSGFAFVQNN